MPDNQVRIPNSLVSDFLSLGARQMWVDYDQEADVLYISFRKPQQANDSIMQDDDHIYHYHDNELVGVTVLHASQKTSESP
jgi:uncharacterized protein YuzE